MRFLLAVAVVLVGISISGLAQQNNTFKVKRSAPEKAPRSVPIGKTASPANGSAANSKDLQTLERQTVKSSAPSRSAGKRTPGTASALKPVKDKPNPPINFGGTGGGKRAGLTKQGADPYKGRLKEKQAHQ
ncbi:MAG TPA: hypothetical protein VE957_15085 [Terriglobales bacterium]|jgi:hypothetical protein|nr:hypothetical protein [Terriglobales bacterium]